MSETHSRSSGCGLASLIAIMGFVGGTYVGYCNAKGIPVLPQTVENAEKMLLYGLTIVSAVAGTVGGTLGGGFLGAYMVLKDDDFQISPLDTIAMATAGGCAGAVVTGIAAGGLSALITGLTTATGYGAGYIIGRTL